MAYTDTRQAFQDLKASTLEGLKSNFPIEGKKNIIELTGLEVRDQHLDPDDIEAQYNAKVEGRSWGAPVFGSLTMKDKVTGQVIDQKVVKLADIPHMTKRHAYIVGGNEYQVDSQWRLKPGVYVRRKENGELESKFQVTNGGFAVLYDKDKKVFKMSRGKSGSIPVYPLLKELGVDDDTLAKSWGKDVLTANQEARAGAGALEAFFRADKKRAPKDKDEARQYFHETMRNSTLRPEATEISMGKAFSSVNGELVTRATKKMLNVMNGVEQADERDALMFKDLYTVADFTKERLQSSNVKRAIQKRVARKIDTADGIRQVVKGGMFSDPVRQTFTDNALARGADQVNPVEMLASSFQTSIMGAGGIQSEQSITDEAKLINPSHLGFLDPIRTPEGCFDEATEVFTSKGWVFWSGVTESTEFACLIDGRLEFHRAEALQAYEYTGKMYGLRKQFEYLVTPNHRMLCRPTDPGLKYRVVRADEMHGKVRAFMSAHSPLLGENKARIKLPHVDGNNSSKNIGSVDIGDWAEFIGWYLSEGNCNYNESKSYYHIKLFQSEINGDCCRRIEQLLDRLGFKWSQVERDNGRNAYSIATKQLAWIVSQLGCTAPKKHLTEDMFSWPLHARQRLIDGLLLGDGRLSHTHKSARQRGYVYTTTSKQLAEDVERMFISLGWAASLKVYKDKREERYLDVYETRLLLHREVTSQPVSVAGKRSSPFYTVDYTGMVYCATVPGSFLYTRRNKKHPLWLGNSKTGITLRLPMGATKRGNQPVIPVYSLKTGKLENIDPTTFHQSRVVLPDQVKWVNGRPVPLSDKVAVSQKGNSLVDSKFSEAEYIMRSPSQMFSMTSNLIPFLGNNSGNRATYGAAQMEQAISLAGREKPLVQVGTGSPGIKTFEDFVGRNSAHVSAVDGTITEVSPGSISIKQANGEVRKVHTYNNFPLNDQKAVLHSEPTVVVGQQVKKGDLLADNNFTRDGSLALGTNLTVGYIPFKGLNFEDGVVISESAAKKMASIHMHKPVVELAPEYITDPGKYRVLHPTSFTKDQFAKVGDNGVVRVGQKVSPGDPLVLATKPYESRGSLSLGKLRKSLSTQHMDASLVWKSDHQGEVVGVHRDGKGNVTVHVRTVEPMQIGDKMTGRAGNKGVVSTVLPDSEMPQLKNGAQVNVSLSRAAGMELQSNLVVGGTTYKAGTKLDPTVLADIRKKDPNAVAHVKQHLEAVLNPSGVPGRMNMGQVLETAASKLAQKTGKTYVVENFISHKDAITQIQKELKNNGIDDQDDVVDPVTGQNLGKALAGPQHMFKLNFQIDKKVSVRSGMPLEGAESEGYDPTTLIPSSGGKTGGQSMGNLGMYSLLAHGAKHNIREMQTWKSEGPNPSERWNSLHNEVWRAIQTGEEPPPPKKTFAFQKFEDMMRASGINVERKGHSFQLLPLTDAQVLTMSSGKLEDERASVGWGKDKNGEPIPKKGGIFDPKLTGGHGGKRWSHMELPEPMPNPVFEGAIQRVLGITRKQYTAVVYGESSLHNGKIVPYDTSLKGAKTGGAAIAEMLSKIDVKKDLASTTKELNSMKLPSDLVHRTSTTALDDLSKKVRMLQALDHAGITPQDAYTIKNLPVIPPVMRPVSFLPSGDIHEADLNKLYTDFGGIVRNMKDPTYIKDVPDSEKRADRANLYDGLKALVGTGPNWEDRGKNPKGLLLQMSGKQPKTGYFQETLLSRRQDMSMRGTITPEPHMSIDEVGLPTHKGLDLFRPFVVKKLQDLGAASSPREAQKLLAAERKKKEPSRIVTRALDLVMGERPVLLKRDPSLHKHSVQAFRARRAPGKAIQIHPLVTGGFGADFDGDSAIGGIIVLDSRCSATSEQSSQDRGNSGAAQYEPVRTLKIVDLAEFPRVEETRTETNSGVIEYSVPPGIYVPGYLNGSIKMYEVTEYSVHPTCVEWVVTTRAGREIRCSSDHSLALFNPETMGVERTPPRRAQGLCLPVMRDISGDPWGKLTGSSEIAGAVDTSVLVGNADEAADVVPVTPDVREALAGYAVGTGSYMLRDSATKILESLPSIPPDLQAWSAIVYDASVGWDVVESAVATGKRITMYDLTVPGALTFTMANGAVVWDTMAVYVPIGREAVKEAYDMLPSKNLYNEATGKVMYTPSLEASLGLFKLSRVTGNTQQKFATHAELLKAAQAGKISMTDTAMVAGKQTTAGRVMIASAVPDAMAPNVLNNLDFRLNKKGVTDLYTKVAKDHRVDFGDVAGKLMNLGYDASYGSLKIPNPATKGTAAAVQQDGENPARHVQFIPMGTHSFGLSDFLPDKAVRDPIVRATQRKVDALELRKGMSKQDKERASINLWFDATEKMVKDHDIKANVNPTNLHLMREAGVKPSPEQYRQLTLAPMLLTDSTNRVLPKPVTKSYAEGLDLGSYWNQMSGARRGSVLKVQEVQDPGYFTKLLMNASIGSQVSTLDCGTNHGVAMDVGDQGVYDRELIQDLTVKGHTFKSGTTLTPDVVQTIKAADKNARVLVRSPLKCEHGKGLCQKCAGLAPDGDYYKMGTNIGVLSTQALGERSTQLTLKAFHSGGVAGRDASMVNDFKRVLELTHLPQKIPDSATIAMKGGTITKIDNDPTGVVVWIDGVRHHIPKDRFGNPLWKSLAGSTKPGWVPPKVGMRVQPGQVLSDPARSNVNVRDLYKATGSMVQVQNHLVNELHGIYGKEGVRRQHVELVVRNLSDLTRVIDPGDDGRSVKGGFTSTNALQSRNKELVKRGLKPAMHTPILKGIDVLPLEAQEDWMAKMNHNHIRTTVADAATYGHASNIHSSNPISGMAYGAEFGMTEKDKFKKPQLAGVPEWSY